MIYVTVQAPDIYSKKSNKVVEDTNKIEIILDGDTYPVKEKIKEKGFKYNDSKWYMIVNRDWFKQNGYAFVQSFKDFGCPLRSLINGEQAKIAVAELIK